MPFLRKEFSKIFDDFFPMNFIEITKNNLVLNLKI